MDIYRVRTSLKKKTNPGLYYLFVGIDLLVFMLYVDDLFLTSVEKLIAR